MARRFKQHEIGELMNKIPPLPKDFGNWMSTVPLKNRNYIFYKRVGKNKVGVCTKCKKLVTYQSKAKHNDIGKCPNCKTKVVYKAINMAKHYEDQEIVSNIQKMAEGYIVRYFKVRRTFKNREDTSEFPTKILSSLVYPIVGWYEGSRVYITFSKRGITQYRNFEESWCGESGDFRWVNERKRSAFNNKELLRDSNPYLYKKNLKSILKKTKWKYSGLDYYVGKYMNIDNYLYTYEKYQSIEMLSKLKLNNLLADVIQKTQWGNNNYGESLNLNKKRLGLDPDTFTKVIDMDLSCDEIKKLIYYKNQGLVLSKKEFTKIKEFNENIIGKILNYSSITKMFNYIKKQQKKLKEDKNLTLGFWKDYLDQCEYLNLNLKESVVIYPRDLLDKHNKYTVIIKKMKDEKVIRKFNEKVLKWSNKLSFKKGNLSIIVSESIDALKNEGKILGHCVGSFGPAVANTDSIVLFLRSKKNEPFYTVEYNLKNFKIVQIQGKGRMGPTKKVDKFLKSWEQHIMILQQSDQQFQEVI